METYKMSKGQAVAWEQEDAAKRDEARRIIRRDARRAAQTTEPIEIVTHDGIVMEVVED